MGGKTSTTTQGVSIPKEVMDRYNAINTRAENVAGTPFQTYSEDPSKFVAQITPQQSMGISNVNAAAGSYAPYFEKAYGSAAAGMASAQPQALNTEQYMNPFQEQVINATMRQMAQANEQAQSGALGTAVSSGAFGGDRAGIAAANLANQQGLAMGSTLAGLNAQNYNQALQTAQQQQGVNLGATQADLARLMQGGQFYAGLGQAAQQAGLQGAEAQINAGTLGQQTEQAGLSALYNQFQQKQAYPFQVAQFLANIGMGTGALSGSTTTTTQPSSYFSDRRLKEDVERIGEGDNGLPIYKYRYKGEPDTHIGFMADEVEKVRPEAVGLHPTGYKTVDYDRATKAEGGVAGPYGSSVGSQPGMGGYVPEAYLPVGQLMMADPGLIDQSNQTLAQQMDAANRFGETVIGLKDKYSTVRDWWNSDQEPASEQGQADRAAGVKGNWRGGVASGYADGGAAYLNAGLRGDQNPVEKRTYLSDILGGQEDAKRRDSLQSPGSVPQARTTGQDVADLAKVAMMFMGMNRGGRTGYATRGGVDDETAYDAMGNPIPATARPAAAPTAAPAPPKPVVDQDLSFSGLGAANAASPTTDVSMGSVRPTRLPAGLAPDTIPMEQLTAAGITGGVAPATPALTAPEYTPDGLRVVPVSENRITGLNPGQTAEPAGWAELAPKIKARESGGDYDALYGFSNRDDGAFAGTKVTDMTVDQAIQFSDPSGPYGQWSKQNLGYVATPMGAYQIVGSTLRDIKENMGLTGDERMTPDLQEAMGKWLYQNRGGAAPWAASEGMTQTSSGLVPSNTSGATEGQRSGLAAGLGNDKPYDERNMLGKMMYDKEGGVNQNALLSLLSGIGTMASSPSRYLGAAVLQGVGGAANTYAGLLKQSADVTARNLENMRSIAMDTMTWNQMNGTNLTPAQYARSVGMNINLPENASAQQILSGAYQSTTGGGEGIEKIDFNTLQNGTTIIDGKTVSMQDDPASLRRFINDNGFFSPDSPIGRQVAIAEQRLAEIEARGGVTFDINGNEVIVPSYVAAQNAQAQNQGNREASIQFRNDAIVRMPVIDQQLADTDKQAMIFTKLEAGALTDQMTSAAAVLDALGLPAPEGSVADKALAQEAIKLASAKMINDLGSMPGGAPRAELDRLAQIAADPNMQPEAVKMILTMQKAALMREQDKYRMRDQWNRENPSQSMDQFAYEQWFSQNRPYTAYYDSVKKSMPLFAGESGSVQKPHSVVDDNDFEKKVGIGQYFVGPDGVTRQRTQ
jgi:hypothetical protein